MQSKCRMWIADCGIKLNPHSAFRNLQLKRGDLKMVIKKYFYGVLILFYDSLNGESNLLPRVGEY